MKISINCDVAAKTLLEAQRTYTVYCANILKRPMNPYDLEVEVEPLVTKNTGEVEIWQFTFRGEYRASHPFDKNHYEQDP